MILPDVLKLNLKVVFVGSAAGDKSAEHNSYYAGPGNKFYKTLYHCGFTDKLLMPHEFRLLPRFGIGLTDLAKFVHGIDNVLKSSDYDPDALIAKIDKFQPTWVCFNGKEAASRFTGVKTKALEYGILTKQIGQTQLFLAPSTSGTANKYWDESIWQHLKNLIN